MARVKREKRQEKKSTVSDRHLDVHLVPAVEILHAHVTEALCAEVFGEIRTTERERKWTLFALSRLWLAAILDAPPSLSHLLQLMRGREMEGFLPEVSASAESFFMKCKDFSYVFFAEVHRRFIERILPEAPKSFAGEVAHLQKKFTDIVVIDGSRLDKVRHRLKILWDEKAAVLPGCILAVYDLFRGITRQVWFDADAASSEFQRATLAVQCLETGTLVLADRLYASSVELFNLLDECGSFGIFRRNKTLSIREVRLLGKGRTKEGLVEDWLVEAGTGKAKRQLRLIRLTKHHKVYEALTNALDPKQLSAQDVVDLYPMRWTVEISQSYCTLKGNQLKFRKADADNLFAGALGAAADSGPPGAPRLLGSRGRIIAMLQHSASTAHPRTRRHGARRWNVQRGSICPHAAANDC